MAIGSTAAGRIKVSHQQLICAGSCRADWQVANSSAATANSAAELLRPATVDDSNVTPITIPEGATRISVRLRYAVATTTCTTAPKAVIVATDTNGVPERIDNVDSDAAGTTLGVADAADPTLVMRDATYFYSDVMTFTLPDLMGNSTLYVLIKTAANYSGGTPAVAVMVKFLN